MRSSAVDADLEIVCDRSYANASFLRTGQLHADAWRNVIGETTGPVLRITDGCDLSAATIASGTACEQALS